MTSFVSASGSPRRKELLRGLIRSFTVHPADIHELTEHSFPSAIPLINASAKAGAVAALYPDAVVMGADTVIEMDDLIIGKPASLEDAATMLMRFSGRTHHVVTAVCLMSIQLRLNCLFCEHTEVKFRTLDPETIGNYLEKVHVLDKAGAYAIQEYGDMLVERITGPMDNVIGLPVEKLRQALYACGLASLILKQAPPSEAGS